MIKYVYVFTLHVYRLRKTEAIRFHAVAVQGSARGVPAVCLAHLATWQEGHLSGCSKHWELVHRKGYKRIQKVTNMRISE